MQEIGELEIRLRDASEESVDRQRAVARAVECVAAARSALDARWARNEEAWAWFHAARREEPRLWSEAAVKARAVDLRQEVTEKLHRWRLEAARNYEKDGVPPLESVIGMQHHLDDVNENDNRKRSCQRGQLIVYLMLLLVVVVALFVVESRGDGLILDGNGRSSWWLVSAVLFGVLGGSFSAAQRVASAGVSAKYPELRWARFANVLRPVAGGAGALVAFAAVEADVLGADVRTSGARIALVCFAAGFSERFISSIAARQASLP